MRGAVHIGTGSRRWWLALAGIAALAVSVYAPATSDATENSALAAAIREAIGEALHSAGPAEHGIVGGVVAPCAGDCDGNGRVAVDELVRAVRIALGMAAIGDCPGLDANGDGRVEVAELVAAVRNALDGCPGRAIESVCGGLVTSVPTLCDLTVRPRITTAFGSLTFSFAVADLEGDLTQICGALALARDPMPALTCDSLPPANETINERVELAPIRLQGAQSGSYVFYLQFRDALGNRSEIRSVTFTVGVRA